MNLLMFNYEYPPLGGGGGVIHQQIAEELARRHTVTVVTSGAPGLAPVETVGGVEVHRVPVWGRDARATASLSSMLSFFPASWRHGRARIAAQRPDVINSHFAVPTGPSAVLLARRAGIPHVLSIHGGDLFDPSKRLSPHRIAGLRQVVAWVLRRADRVVAPSRNTAENASRFFGYAGAVTIIPHGLRPPWPASRTRAELGFTERQRVLITVGRLVARKANDQLVRLLAGLEDPAAVLVIVGDGPQRAELEALARTLGVADRVVFTGFVDEQRKHDLLRAADVFVSATTHEGFGLMYVEALACGLPIVTYDHGGQSDFLVDGRTGFLVPLDAPDVFQRRVAQLLQDPALRRRLGAENRVLAERFTIERCAAEYERVFAEVAGARAAA